MNIEALQKIIFNSSKINSEKNIPREQYFSWLVSGLDNNFVKVVSGFRRTGKSFLLKQLKNYLITKKGVSENNIFFVNFEHYALKDSNTVEDLRKMVELFEVEMADIDQKVFLFLDEIQHVDGWEKFIRTIYDSNKEKYSIYLTGSNSALLSSEFSTALGGRTIEKKVYPFDFKEYLDMQGFNISELETTFGKVEHKNELEKYVRSFLKYGGLPETIDKKDMEVSDYVESVFKKILLDDIVKRFKITKTFIIEKLFYFLISNIGSVVSFTNIAKQLLQASDKVSVPTLQKYANYYEQSFALAKIRKFDWQTKKIFDQQYKFYTVDNSLITFLNISHLKDFRDKLLENIVANELFKKYKSVYYGRNNDNKEIDFIVQDKEDSFLKIQVTLELDDKNKKRELGNFKLADKYLQKGKNILITLQGESQTHEYNGIEVEEVTLLDFLLN
jgi:predicted AAA+ superfamily ATPase